MKNVASYLFCILFVNVLALVIGALFHTEVMWQFVTIGGTLGWVTSHLFSKPDEVEEEEEE